MAFKDEDEFIFVLDTNGLVLLTLEEAKKEGISYSETDIIRGSELNNL